MKPFSAEEAFERLRIAHETYRLAKAASSAACRRLAAADRESGDFDEALLEVQATTTLAAEEAFRIADVVGLWLGFTGRIPS